MKHKAFLKLTAKSTIKNLPRVLLAYGIFPIFLALIIGYFQKDAFTPSVENPIMKISIVDEDNTIQSENLISFLNSEEMGKIIEIDSEDYKYKLIIPKGYEESLSNKNENNVEIHMGKKASTMSGKLLGDLIDGYNIEISKAIYIEGKMLESNISQEEISIMGEKILKAYNTELIENKFIKVKKSLSSFEHSSITFLSYMIFLVLMNSNADTKENSAFHNRIMSTPITKIQHFNCEYFAFYFMALFLNTIYIMTYRITGLSFQGSLPILILLIIVQSLLVTTISGFLTAFFRKKILVPILYILMLLQLILGVSAPAIEGMNFEFLKIISKKYSPDILISSTFRNYLIYNNLESIRGNLILIIGISIGLYILSILKLKWSGNYENPTT